MSEADSLTGRTTRGWPVFDLKTNDLAFLKDAWRSLLPDLAKESAILKELTEAQVRNIPKYICGDDIKGQVTLTQKFVSKSWKAGETATSTTIKIVHHRLLTDVVGIHTDVTAKNVAFGKCIHVSY